ncbi:hypothetical protein [Saccharopolyspora hattusasensis]|uniref:hypothetical protein n=1 Tax=Saccharopolyspora hattusasensis TaxID=1128679 RepID=UPI003D95715A
MYREAPLSSIREGSGNVTALDLLRALDPPMQFPLKSKVQFQWKMQIIGVSHSDTPMAVDNFRNFNGNQRSDLH